MTPIEKMIAFIEKFPTLHGQDYLNYARALGKEEQLLNPRRECGDKNIEEMTTNQVVRCKNGND